MATKTTLLITGGNTGIGYSAVEHLCQSSRTYDILLAGRSLQKAQDAAAAIKKDNPESSSTIEAVQCDVTSDESINGCYEHVSKTRGVLDVLVNNAGANFDTAHSQGKLTIREAWNASWDTNVTGTQIMTHTFVPLLLKSPDPRLIFLASGTATLTETEDHSSPMGQRLNASPPAGWPKPPGPASGVPGYRSAKTGLNMMMREWNRVLRGDGVKVFCMSPGFLASGLGGWGKERLRSMGAGDVSLGGEFLREVVEGGRDGDVGVVIRKGARQPW